MIYFVSALKNQKDTLSTHWHGCLWGDKGERHEERGLKEINKIRACGNKMAGKKNVLSSLAVYDEDSEAESDGEAGVETAGSAAGEAREGKWKGRIRLLLH